MFYIYHEKKLTFKRLSIRFYLKLILFLVIFFGISNFLTYYHALNKKFNELSKAEKTIIISNTNDDVFNKEKMISMMKNLNVKYPWIPIAQSILETGYWKSDIFLQNNNLFGMKEAKQRITTSQGTNFGHAYYTTWRESVYDYAFYQARYLNHRIKSEEQYFEYLSANYAEDTMYIRKIKHIIQKENLKSYFIK